MSKKKLLALPVIAVVLTAFFSFSVMAAESGDPENTGFRVYQNNGMNGSSDDVTSHFNCDEFTMAVDITKDNNLKSKLSKINKDLKPSDFTNMVSGMEITPKDDYTGKGPWKVLLTIPVDSDEIGIVAHLKYDGSVDCRVFQGNGKSTCAYMEDVNDFYPFVLYTSKVSNAKPVDYALAYVLLFSLALMVCGMFFTIRAMRSTKI